MYLPASGSHRKAAYAAKIQGLREPLLYSRGPALGKTSRPRSKNNRARKVLSKQNNDHNSTSQPLQELLPCVASAVCDRSIKDANFAFPCTSYPSLATPKGPNPPSSCSQAGPLWTPLSVLFPGAQGRAGHRCHANTALGAGMSCLQAAAGCYNNRGVTDSGFHFRTKAGKKEGGPGCLTAALSLTGASPSCQERPSSRAAPSDALGWGLQAGGLRKM